MNRYDVKYSIGTDLDPIEDLLIFMSTLKSKGYTKDLLKSVHNITNTAELEKNANLIKLHMDNAIGLAEQAFSGPPETSFLPLYYSTLNLNKVYLIILGKRIQLAQNRWHGASYSENHMSRNFLNEEINVKRRGTIPLIYNTLTGKSIPNAGIKVKLSDIYPYITSIGAEYGIITKMKEKMMQISSKVINDPENGHHLKVEILNDDYLNAPPQARSLKAFSGLSLINPENGAPYYVTQKRTGNFNIIERQLINSVKRYLNSDDLYGFNNWISSTPISNRNHVFNEELCITLAYFHLSNVVRYNPEHLFKLMDSKYWSILLALRKHGYLRFLKLMWGNFNKYSFDIV